MQAKRKRQRNTKRLQTQRLVRDIKECQVKWLEHVERIPSERKQKKRHRSTKEQTEETIPIISYEVSYPVLVMHEEI
jgi:hypothetical protein